ncbi:MAG TPA: pyridoxamine 5'-phosphate oxidase family protein [Steroidobacteraceae bacterium]|nr:pyridoxamine 5'-phosphate oxidase family protein [Steroidobacteraceae bacterium]
MTQAQSECNIPLSRLLAGAAKAIAGVRYCWLLTGTETDWLSARPMGRLQSDLEQDDWRFRLVADGRSRKARELRRTGRAAAVIQSGDEAFVTLTGIPTLHADVGVARQLLKKSFEVYFPSEEDRAHAAVIEIDTRRMDLWIRGVTPEPFGMQPVRLERDVARRWQLIPHEA